MRHVEFILAHIGWVLASTPFVIAFLLGSGALLEDCATKPATLEIESPEPDSLAAWEALHASIVRTLSENPNDANR